MGPCQFVDNGGTMAAVSATVAATEVRTISGASIRLKAGSHSSFFPWCRLGRLVARGGPETGSVPPADGVLVDAVCALACRGTAATTTPTTRSAARRAMEILGPLGLTIDSRRARAARRFARGLRRSPAARGRSAPD